MPEPIMGWSLTRSQGKAVIRIGAKVVGHARCVAFQMTEIAISKNLFAMILRMIAELQPPPVASTGWKTARRDAFNSKIDGDVRHDGARLDGACST